MSATGAWTGCVVHTASAKPRRGRAMSEKARSVGGQQEMFSFVPPSAGMFLWLRLHFENAPGFRAGDEETMEIKLWTSLAEAGVLVGPGRYFAAEDDGASPVEGHFRISFSFASVCCCTSPVLLASRSLTPCPLVFTARGDEEVGQDFCRRLARVFRSGALGPAGRLDRKVLLRIRSFDMIDQ